MLQVEVTVADLCDVEADGICTSTNPNLALMIGTGGAVRDRGGWVVQQECERLIADEHGRSGHRYFQPGTVHLTTAGQLPFRGVIHCVASDAFHATSAEVIRSCVLNAVALADERKWTTIAMPLFGTGHVAFPVEKSVAAVAGAVADVRTEYLRRIIIATRTEAHRDAMLRATQGHG